MKKKRNPYLHQPDIDNTTVPPLSKLNSKAFTVEEVRKMLEKDELTGKYINVSEVTFHSADKQELRGLGVSKVFIDECTELPGISFMSNKVLDIIFKKQTLDYIAKLKEAFVSSISKIIPECNESNIFDYLKNVLKVSGKNGPNKEKYYYMISENEKILLFETENKIEQTENGYTCEFILKLNNVK